MKQPLRLWMVGLIIVSKEDVWYAISLDWPEQELLIKTLGSQNEWLKKDIKTIHLLGSEEELDWKQTEEGLVIQVPSKPAVDHAFVFKIQ